MAAYGSAAEDEYVDPPNAMFGEDPPGPINWNLLDAETAEAEWRDLDAFVLWLKATFGLPPSILPPLWHRHDELIWELSALHSHFLACFEETASPSAPIAWMRDFAEARHRLREWVSLCGTRLDRDRPTRQPAWPGEESDQSAQEIEIRNRTADFEAFVTDDISRRRRVARLIDSRLDDFEVDD